VIADVGIAVVGEQPYAEGVGDRADRALSDVDASVITRLRERSKLLVVILLSGRPMIVTEQLRVADAFVAAWLPGAEGAGVADILFGDFPFTGKLPYTWPRTNAQLPFDFAKECEFYNCPNLASILSGTERLLRSEVEGCGHDAMIAPLPSTTPAKNSGLCSGCSATAE